MSEERVKQIIDDPSIPVNTADAARYIARLETEKARLMTENNSIENAKRVIRYDIWMRERQMFVTCILPFRSDY